MKPSCPKKAGFTLVELLTVMAIIGVLAAFTFPIMSGITRMKYINATKAEMAALETAIDSYHAVYGFYPPSNPNNVLINQLYYELEGTTNINPASPVFQPLDGSSPAMPAANVQMTFGAGGFVNCSKPGGDEDSKQGRNFLPELPENDIFRTYTNSTTGIQGMAMLISPLGGPDQSYAPLGLQGLNPWRYNSSNPVNNPGGYELYMQLKIKGKTYLVCNWNKTVQINSSLP
jgi:prepilin-type N-terminal cleavage/methylation domain-containing protein